MFRKVKAPGCHILADHSDCLMSVEPVGNSVRLPVGARGNTRQHLVANRDAPHLYCVESQSGAEKIL